ncbi:MAG: hypothetical protein J7527_13645, partial [Chitinophagaceae bacterium]|nr:hypothetical protein [Chitinophagaceae bacterium]
RISDAQIPNFGPAAKTALARVGIQTAGDFTDISKEGYFKTRSGNWQKAIGVGLNRARDLQVWQKSLETNENRSIEMQVKRKYEGAILIAKSNIKSLELAFEKEMTPFQTLYNRDKAAKEKEKQNTNENLNKEKLLTVKKYDALHENLAKKAKDFVSQITLPKIKEVSSDTVAELAMKFNDFLYQFSLKTKEIKEYTEAFKIEVLNLNTLYQDPILQPGSA